ncbi:hypothetical protein BGX38DRAFT_239709 [Terfezia claveryi]|nr:hypothetical protein BGX38DRAFT_239709 [Terfezia claveryi]
MSVAPVALVPPSLRSHPQSNGIDRKQGQHSKRYSVQQWPKLCYLSFYVPTPSQQSPSLQPLGVLRNLVAPPLRYTTCNQTLSPSFSFPVVNFLALQALLTRPLAAAPSPIAKTTLHQSAASAASPTLGRHCNFLCGTIYNYERTGFEILPAGVRVPLCVCMCVCVCVGV